MALTPEANGVNSGIQHLLDWLLFVQCAVHAIHNGLSWGLASEFDSDAVSMTRTLHIASASLRNTMNELYTEMPKFLEDVLELKEPMSAQQHNDNAVFWNSFQDLHEDLVNECTELELQYVNGKLHVKATPMPRPDLIQRVTKLMQGMSVFLAWTTSRWCTMGKASRRFLAALSLGLHDLVQRIVADPGSHKYYIRGFAKLQACHRRIMIVSGYAGFGAEGVLHLLEEDGRLIRQAEAIRASMAATMHWLQNLPFLFGPGCPTLVWTSVP